MLADSLQLSWPRWYLPKSRRCRSNPPHMLRCHKHLGQKHILVLTSAYVNIRDLEASLPFNNSHDESPRYYDYLPIISNVFTLIYSLSFKPLLTYYKNGDHICRTSQCCAHRSPKSRPCDGTHQTKNRLRCKSGAS